jgi:hypothetical protein
VCVLFVRANATAIRVYESIGMQRTIAYRSPHLLTLVAAYPSDGHSQRHGVVGSKRLRCPAVPLDEASVLLDVLGDQVGRYVVRHACRAEADDDVTALAVPVEVEAYARVDADVPKLRRIGTAVDEDARAAVPEESHRNGLWRSRPSTVVSHASLVLAKPPRNTCAEGRLVDHRPRDYPAQRAISDKMQESS